MAAERAIGTVLQFGLEGSDLPDLLRKVATSIEELGAGVEVLDVMVRADALVAEVYFLRVDENTALRPHRWDSVFCSLGSRRTGSRRDSGARGNG